MEKDLNSLTVSELLEIRSDYESKKFKRAIGIVIVEGGFLTCTFMTKTEGTGKSKVTDVLTAFMPFSRTSKLENKEIPLYWDAVKFEGIHNESGKEYSDLKVNADDQLLKDAQNPANIGRKCTLLSKVTKDSQGRDRSVLSFVKWN